MRVAYAAIRIDEAWPRYVLKLATGTGKTKALSLLIAWSSFHRLYEPQSTLARNCLLIAPNIIVLDCLRHDFDGLRILFRDRVLPDNGFEGRNWRDDFQMTLHLRDYFLAPFGPKAVGSTNESRADLGEIISEIDELAVFNDELDYVQADGNLSSYVPDFLVRTGDGTVYVVERPRQHRRASEDRASRAMVRRRHAGGIRKRAASHVRIPGGGVHRVPAFARIVRKRLIRDRAFSAAGPIRRR